jgi:two-component system sensor histidine kinase and response regulator WspE
MTDAALLQLFEMELKEHAAALDEGLLEMENNPQAVERFEPMMRAAHSIKGSARVVDLEPAVQIAHAMEDCFVAFQNRKTTFKPEAVDLLLKGVDLLRTIAGTAAQDTEGTSPPQNAIDAFIQSTRKLIESPTLEEPDNSTASDGPSAAATDPPAEKLPTISEEAFSTTTESAPSLPSTPSGQQPPVISDNTPVEHSRAVRITAEKIDNLIGLTGEMTVNTGWLSSFMQSLLTLKKEQDGLMELLKKLRERLGQETDNEQLQNLLLKALTKARTSGVRFMENFEQLERYSNRSAGLSDLLYHEIVGIRMRPFADGIQGFPRMVRDMSRKLGKQVAFEIKGKSTEVDRDVLEKLDAPLTHLLRNAIDHGIEIPSERTRAGKPPEGSLFLEASHRSGMLMLTVGDDGRGVDIPCLKQTVLSRGLASGEIVEKLTESEILKFLFLPGFSMADTVTEFSGRGVGLDVVESMIREIGGNVRVSSVAGKGTTFHLQLPLTLSVMRTFLVEIAGEPYAFPLVRIDHCLCVEHQDIHIVEDRQYITLNDRHICLVDLHHVLHLQQPPVKDNLSVVIVSSRNNQYGLVVDKFSGECDLVVRPLDARFGKVPDIGAVSVMFDGSPILIIDIDDVISSIDTMLDQQRLRKLEGAPPPIEKKAAVKHILVVDDSITVREMERKLLENRGYTVEVAVDGLAGWNSVRTQSFDLIISDIDMPRMNGFELVENIRGHDRLKSLPVIIVSYKDSEENRLKGLQAGANYYLTKSSFQDDSFINAVVDLVGDA